MRYLACLLNIARCVLSVIISRVSAKEVFLAWDILFTTSSMLLVVSSVSARMRSAFMAFTASGLKLYPKDIYVFAKAQNCAA